MQDWWTYRLSDFLLFSPRTYYRMFELYHGQIWPAHLVVLVSVIAAVVLLRRDDEMRNRAIAALLAASWLWVGIAFHLQRYATINWAAKYFAALFVIQGLLLLWFGVSRGRLRVVLTPGRATRIGVGLIAVALALLPLAGVLAGRTWRQVEVAGLTPDATAIATIGLLALTVSRVPRALLVLPVVWCVIGGATLWALDSGDAWIVLLSGLGGLALATRYAAALEPPPVKSEEGGGNKQ